MPEVELPYRPRRWADAFHATFKRFAACVLHRRAGKTTAFMNGHQRYCLDNDLEATRLKTLKPDLTANQIHELVHPPGGRHYGHVLPLRTQAKLVVWDKLKHYAQPLIDGGYALPNESELLIRYPGGHKLQLFGADNPDALRGPAFSGISFDEYSQQPRNIYSEVISKALADHLGYAWFGGTIKGKDHLYQTYEGSKNSDDWFTLWQDVDRSLATEDGITIQLLKQAMADDRAQIAMGLMTQDEYDQEWFLSPEAAIKGAIYGKELTAARLEGRITRVPYDPVLQVETYWDLGRNMAIWFVQSTRSGEVRLIDYYEDAGASDLPACIKIVKAKPYVYARHVAPHDIEVTEIGSGRTRLETARQLGLVFAVAPKLSIEEGINAVKVILPRCYFDETKCAAGLEALRNYRRDFNARLNEYKDTPLHDWSSHGSDGFRYLAVTHKSARDPRVRGSRPVQSVSRDAWMG